MRRWTIMAILILLVNYSKAQGIVGIKTNILYGAATFTPNLGVEIGLGKNTTLDISAGYNPWKVNHQKKLAHFIIQPEFRYFFCERFTGQFIGAHLLYSEYNIGKHKLPMLFGKESKNYRYQGYAYGGGISYGYQLFLSCSFNLEFAVGVGYARLNYSQYNCDKCGNKIRTTHKNYFGPTKASISLIYLIR